MAKRWPRRGRTLGESTLASDVPEVSVARHSFALVLHTHLPMVINHGRWPHGSDWLTEATFECYLPLLETMQRLVAGGVSPKWTINVSPVLAEQLASPEFQRELAFYADNIRRTCADSRTHFDRQGDRAIVAL